MNFDDEWITNFEQTQKKQMTIKVVYCYVDEDNIMQKINQDIITVVDCVLTRDEVVKLVVRNKNNHQLLSILTYIVNDIADNPDYHDFFKSVNIEEIDLRESSLIFESTNSVFFIFKKMDKKLKHNGTKKVYITPSRNTRRIKT